jgi:hypothetical protein
VVDLLADSIHRSGFKPMAMLGRGSGEAFQMAFAGQGFVIVQPGENPPRGALQQTGNTRFGGLGGKLSKLGGF